MSLATNLTNLATRIATEFKSHRTLINGNAVDLSALTTTAKTNLVAAINEVAAASGGAVIDDEGASALTAWSSSKTDAQIDAAVAALVAASPEALDTLQELAAALGDDANFATTITNALAAKVNAADVGSTSTDLVAAFEAGLV